LTANLCLQYYLQPSAAQETRYRMLCEDWSRPREPRLSTSIRADMPHDDTELRPQGKIVRRYMMSLPPSETVKLVVLVMTFVGEGISK